MDNITHSLVGAALAEVALRDGASPAERRLFFAVGIVAAWQAAVHQSLAVLRELAARDCWARAWLQFGRAPVLRAGEIRHLRFETPRGGNFTALPLRPRARPRSVRRT